MQNNDTEVKKGEENLNGFKDDLTEAKKIHQKITDLGFEHIVARLKEYGFSDPENLAKQILEKEPKEISETKNTI